MGVRPRVEDSRRGHFACAWCVVSSQLGDAEAMENRPALVELEILRQLVVWAATSEKTLQGVNTGRNKLLSAASALDIQMPGCMALPLAQEPVIRYQWLILKAALEPKANGDPIKFSSLSCTFDAVAWYQQETGAYSSREWQIGQGVRLSGTTCHFSATTLMKQFRKGLSTVMGTASSQAVCVHFQVVVDLQAYGERQWTAASATTNRAARLLRLHVIARATTGMLAYSLTCARPGELDATSTSALREWEETLPGTGAELDLHFIHAKIPWSKTDQSGNGYSLYLARETASGLRLTRWMRRLHRLNVALGFSPDEPAFADPATKKVLTGADLMKDTLLPWMRAIAAQSPPMPSTNYLKSVDWTILQLRSFRRTGIHRMRLLKVDKDVINYFGRWKAGKREAMQVRYDKLAISESVAAVAAM